MAGELRTICVKCLHHKGPRPVLGRWFGRVPSWYDHRCVCPEVAHDPGIDPVTGLKQPLEHPHCKEVNRDGECGHYVR